MPADAALLWRGRAHYEKGDTEKAIDDFTEATRLDAGLMTAYQERARAYEKIQEEEKEPPTARRSHDWTPKPNGKRVAA